MIFQNYLIATSLIIALIFGLDCELEALNKVCIEERFECMLDRIKLATYQNLPCSPLDSGCTILIHSATSAGFELNNDIVSHPAVYIEDTYRVNIYLSENTDESNTEIDYSSLIPISYFTIEVVKFDVVISVDQPEYDVEFTGLVSVTHTSLTSFEYKIEEVIPTDTNVQYDIQNGEFTVIIPYNPDSQSSSITLIFTVTEISSKCFKTASKTLYPNSKPIITSSSTSFIKLQDRHLIIQFTLSDPNSRPDLYSTYTVSLLCGILQIPFNSTPSENIEITIPSNFNPMEEVDCTLTVTDTGITDNHENIMSGIIEFRLSVKNAPVFIGPSETVRIYKHDTNWIYEGVKISSDVPNVYARMKTSQEVGPILANDRDLRLEWAGNSITELGEEIVEIEITLEIYSDDYIYLYVLNSLIFSIEIVKMPNILNIYKAIWVFGDEVELLFDVDYSKSLMEDFSCEFLEKYMNLVSDYLIVQGTDSCILSEINQVLLKFKLVSSGTHIDGPYPIDGDFTLKLISKTDPAIFTELPFKLTLSRLVISFNIPNLFCNINSPCAIDMKSYITANSEYDIINPTLSHEPKNESEGIMTVSSDLVVNWTPTGTIGTSGLVHLTFTYEENSIAETYFEVYVNRPPRIASIPAYKSNAVESNQFTYKLDVYDEDFDQFSCTMQHNLKYAEFHSDKTLYPEPRLEENLTIVWDNVQIINKSSSPSIDFEITCQDVRSPPAESSRILEVSIVTGCTINIENVPVFIIGYENSFLVNISDSIILLDKLELSITDNRPPTMSLEEIDRDTMNGVITYRVKWIPPVGSTNFTMKFECGAGSLSTSSSKYIDISISTLPSFSISITNPMIILGQEFDYVGEFSVNRDSFRGCRMITGNTQDLTGMDLINDTSKCIFTWSKSAISEFGVKETDAIRIQAVGTFYEISEVSVILYPNRAPIITCTQFDFSLQYSRMNHFLNIPISASDDESLTFQFSISPAECAFLSFDSSSLSISGTSTLVSSTSCFFTLNATDTHPTPLSSTYSNTILFSESINHPPSFLCPDSSSFQDLIIGTTWQYAIQPSSGNDKIDIDDDDIVWSMSKDIRSFRIEGDVIIWNVESRESRESVVEVEIYATDSKGARSDICNLRLEPSSNMKIEVEDIELEFEEDEEFVYVAKISNQVFRVEDLIKSIQTDSDVKPEINAEGVITWKFDNLPMHPKSHHYDLTLTLQEPSVPSRQSTSISSTFSVTVNSRNDPPQIVSPTILTNTSPIKQYAQSGTLQEDTEFIYEITVYDEESQYDTLKITLYNAPAGMIDRKKEGDNTVFQIVWTPAEGQHCSGNVRIRISEEDDGYYDEMELVLCDILLKEDPPVFITVAPVEVVKRYDSDYFIFEFEWNDPDTPYEYVEVELNEGDGPSLNLKVVGKQTIVRTPNLIGHKVEKEIIIILSSFGVRSEPFKFTMSVEPRPDKPQIISWKNKVISEEITSITIKDMIEYTDPDLDATLYLCLFRKGDYTDQDKYGTLDEQNLPTVTWSNIDYEMFTSGIFEIRVSDEPNCEESTSYDSRELVICKDYTCKQYPQEDDLTIYCQTSCTNPTKLIIYSLLDIDTILIGTRECTYTKISDNLWECYIPEGVYGINIPVFINTDKGYSIPITSFTIYQANSETLYSLIRTYQMPTNLVYSHIDYIIGKAGEKIRVSSSNGYMKDFFSCYIEIEGIWRESLYIYLDSNVGYCILPELDIGTYTIILCADEAYLDYYKEAGYPSNMCSNTGSLTVCGESEFVSTTNLSGKSSGNYSRSFIAKLTSCWNERKPTIYLRFGNYYILEIPSSNISQASSSTTSLHPSFCSTGLCYEISFLVPPNIYPSSTASIPIYISASGLPMKFNSTPAQFLYTGKCISDNISEGKYCLDGNLVDCPAGSFCDNTISTVITPTPCPPGTYSTTGLSSCKICDVGYMCNTENMSSPVLCPAGWVCNYPGIDYPRIPCPPGFYCPEGTNSHRVLYSLNPSESDVYTDYYELRKTMDNKDRSEKADHWSNRGQLFDESRSDYKVPGFIPDCIKDYYEKGKKAEDDDDLNPVESRIIRRHPIVCQPGRFCLWATAEDKVQDDTVDGKLRWFSSRSCSSGYSCFLGYGEAFDNDISCAKTKFCPGINFDHPLCLKLYDQGTERIECQICECPEGYICPEDGMAEPNKCPAGMYQDECGQTQCKECPMGYYCLEGTNHGQNFAIDPPDSKASDLPIISAGIQSSNSIQSSSEFEFTSSEVFNYTRLLTSTSTSEYTYLNSDGTQYIPIHVYMYRCKKGHYCEAGFSNALPCQKGQYQDNYGQSDCKICPIGAYCPSAALENYIICPGGYLCPNTGIIEAKKCPPGFYCTEGTDYLYEDCNYDKIEECKVDMSKEYICPEGKICPRVCQPGYKCPIGSARPQECSLGYYQPQYAATYCEECQKGYFCPLESNIAPIKCTPGFCCSSTGLPTPNGQCPGGYTCGEGTMECLPSSERRQLQLDLECDYQRDVSSYVVNGLQLEPIICPAGTYCPPGTSSLNLNDKKGPIPCLRGSFSQFCGADQCRICGNGFECLETGMTVPSLCKPGHYKFGSNIECMKCPTGRYGAGIQGLVYEEECQLCPAGYMCNSEGLGDISELQLCTPGFYCPEGTINAKSLCPEGTFCPAGVKNDVEAKMYLCPAKRYCGKGTAIQDDRWEECKDNISECIVGLECPANKYCPQGTGNTPMECPQGTISLQGSADLDSCVSDPRQAAAIYGTVIALTRTMNLDPMSWNLFKLNTANIPDSARTPEDYLLIISIISQDETYKIPFIEIYQDYTPQYKLPIMNSYKSYISNSTQIMNLTGSSEIEFIILAHRSLIVTFEIQILNGLYSDPIYMKRFEDTIEHINTLHPEREKYASFLAVLNRNSADEFYEPSNLAICDEMSRDVSSYSIAENIFITAAGFSILSPLPDIKEDASATDLLRIWDELSVEQKLYPLDYIPYITDCEGWGSYLPIYLLVNYTECELVDTSDTITVEFLNPFQLPQGDVCDFSISCNYAENISELQGHDKSFWFEASEISNSATFYISRNQFSRYTYESYIPSISTNDLSFSNRFYGSGDLIEVKAERLDTSYEKGMVPRKVKLSLGYYQKYASKKEILKARLQFDEFDDETSNRHYEFEFELYPLEFIECLNLFAFESYLYYVIILLLCLVILGLIIIFWAYNYFLSKIAPKPRLKVRLYFMHSINGLKGILMACMPVLSLVFGLSQLILSLTYLKYYTGDHDDTEPIDPENPVDLARIDKYRYGRTAWIFCIAGWYVILRGACFLFPPPNQVEKYEDRNKLILKGLKMRGLFLWQLILILIFSIAIYQFSHSDVFKQNSTYFILVFKLVNLKLVDIFKNTMNDELYVLPYFGVMSLTVMIITVEVGEFTKFLQGYLIQVSIKFFKRAFIEPSRLIIKNRLNRFKSRLGLKAGRSEMEGLSFKDQVYVEQVQDLGSNSIEYIAAWLFPTMIVFQYYFYDLLKIPTAKEFFQYFIILSFIQGFAEIFYGIFLNNAIECKSGRLLSERITELSRVFKSRKTRWALSDATVHSGKQLSASQNTIQRLGFSTQHYFLMSFLTLGCMFQIFSYDIWVKWSYNPFKDPTVIVILPSVIVVCVMLEVGVIYIGRKFDVWKLKRGAGRMKVPDFYESISYYVNREMESAIRKSKEEVINYSIARAILDQYKSANQEHKRESLVARYLKNIEEAYVNLSDKLKDNREELLELPKVRQKSHYLIIKDPSKLYTTKPNLLTSIIHEHSFSTHREISSSYDQINITPDQSSLNPNQSSYIHNQSSISQNEVTHISYPNKSYRRRSRSRVVKKVPYKLRSPSLSRSKLKPSYNQSTIKSSDSWPRVLHYPWPILNN